MLMIQWKVLQDGEGVCEIVRVIALGPELLTAEDAMAGRVVEAFTEQL